MFRQCARTGGGEEGEEREEEGIAGLFHFTTYFSFDLFLFFPVWSSAEKGDCRVRDPTRGACGKKGRLLPSSSSPRPKYAPEGKKRDKGRESSINRRRTYTSKAAALSKLGEYRSSIRWGLREGGGRSK